MPILHVYTDQLTFEQKSSFAKIATDIFVQTLNANAASVKILFNEYLPDSSAVGGVLGAGKQRVFQSDLYILEGRTRQQHIECIQALAKAAQDCLQYEQNFIRIHMQEMQKSSYSIGGAFLA